MGTFAYNGTPIAPSVPWPSLSRPLRAELDIQQFAGKGASCSFVSRGRDVFAFAYPQARLRPTAGGPLHPLKIPDPRGEFVRQCAPHMVGRWAHPESVCGCLHDHAAAAVDDIDLREALLRGIGETGVPTIETEWVPPRNKPRSARPSPKSPNRPCNACSIRRTQSLTAGSLDVLI